MNAIQKLQPIAVRTLLHPAYAWAGDLESFKELNRVALNNWYEQLRAHDDEPQTFVPFDEFCAVQYDREIALRERLRHEAKDEPRYETWQDRDRREYD